MRCPYCDGKGFTEVLSSASPGDLDIERDPCEDCDGTGVASAYTASAMGSARAEYRADRPYLRMAREAGVKITSKAECERFKEDVF